MNSGVEGASARTPEPPARWDLAGRRALVTGASRGIGAAVTEALASAGADIVLSGRTAEVLEVRAHRLATIYGVRTAVVVADLERVSDIEGLAESSLDAFGGLDILVSNAGIAEVVPAVDVGAEAWDRVLAVNARAPALLGARIGRAMSRRGRGSIINIASVAGSAALAEHYAYCASKAALIMATKVLALELGPLGVRANTVSPTVVLTEMGQRVWGGTAKGDAMLARIPLGRFAETGDIGNAVAFLASDASSMVNGTDLLLDGGFAVG